MSTTPVLRLPDGSRIHEELAEGKTTVVAVPVQPVVNQEYGVEAATAPDVWTVPEPGVPRPDAVANGWPLECKTAKPISAISGGDFLVVGGKLSEGKTKWGDRITADPETGAKKGDTDKIRTDLLPFGALEEIAKVLKHGSEKYGDHNWAAGMAWSRLLGSTLRHLFAWAQGEDRDQESSLPHLSHAACNLLFLITYEQQGLGVDDRHKHD